MYEFSRRAFLKGLGKVTAALGVGMSLGSGCAKEEPEKKMVSQEERFERAQKASQGRKYIVGLSCGSDRGFCETFIRAAALGAAEFGVETELIRASTLEVNVFEGDPNDDVPWIHEKTLMEEAALICAVPCYHVRANSLFYAINERMLMVRDQYRHNNRNDRVGAVIGVGGSGYDGWASLTNLSTEIFMQHTRKIVDQAQFNFCGLREWNLWMQQGKPLTSNTHKRRVIDYPFEEVYTMWGKQPSGTEYFEMAVERAKQMGRNVAQAMNMPIEEVEYKGEKAGVECPNCHCNVLLVPEDLPYVGCPVCWIRGTIVADKDGKIKLEWNMNDLEMHRFSSKGLQHHMQYTGRYHIRRTEEAGPLKEKVFEESESTVRVVTPT